MDHLSQFAAKLVHPFSKYCVQVWSMLTLTFDLLIQKDCARKKQLHQCWPPMVSVNIIYQSRQCKTLFNKKNENFSVWKKLPGSRSTCRMTLLWTSSERRTLFTTVDYNSGAIVVLCLQQFGLMLSWIGGRITICTYSIFETKLSPHGRVRSRDLNVATS